MIWHGGGNALLARLTLSFAQVQYHIITRSNVTHIWIFLKLDTVMARVNQFVYQTGKSLHLDVHSF